MLIEKEISPLYLRLQTGHTYATMLKYYIRREPQQKQLLTFGGWHVAKPLLAQVLDHLT